MRDWLKDHAVELVFGVIGSGSFITAFANGVSSLFSSDPLTMGSWTAVAFSAGFIVGWCTCVSSGKRESKAIAAKAEAERALAEEQAEKRRKAEAERRKEEESRMTESLSTPQKKLLAKIYAAQEKGESYQTTSSSNDGEVVMQLERTGAVVGGPFDYSSLGTGGPSVRKWSISSGWYALVAQHASEWQE